MLLTTAYKLQYTSEEYGVSSDCWIRNCGGSGADGGFLSEPIDCAELVFDLGSINRTDSPLEPNTFVTLIITIADGGTEFVNKWLGRTY